MLTLHIPNIVLKNANLEGANLSGAHLESANLSGAHLWDANLSGANLFDANFSASRHFPYLWLAKLSGANFYKSDINNIENWQKIEDINKTNIYGVKNAPDGFIEWAKEHGALSIEDWHEWQKMLKQSEPTKE